jgi:hypothetical protein
MQINLVPDASVGLAPAGFTAAVQAAAAVFDQDFPGNYTVNIAYGWGTINNQPDPTLVNPNSGAASVGGPVAPNFVSYATIKSWLTGEAVSSDQVAAAASLPASNNALPGNANSFFVSTAQEKAFGTFTGSSSTIDGEIGFNLDQASDQSTWMGLALCEIGHALGWMTDSYAGAPTILDLFRFASTGQRQWTGDQPAYFSINGGTTDLANFATSFDYTLFTNASSNDPFIASGVLPSAHALTSLDLEVLHVIGFGASGLLPPPLDHLSVRTPGSTAVTQGANTVIDGVQVVDDGSDSNNETFTVVINDALGILSATGPGVTGSGAHDLTVTGTLSQVNAALATLSYSSSSGGGDIVSVDAIDSDGSTSTRGVSVTIDPAEGNLVMRDGNSGGFYIYAVDNNQLLGAYPMGEVGLDWQVAGFGNFSGVANETDMLMRHSADGAFYVYDISNNQIAGAAPMGQVGLDWEVAGVGDFSGVANETDMLMRHSTDGAFYVYDISNNQLTGAAPMGQVGLDWQVAGFGNFSGHANETDMLMRHTTDGAFYAYDISNDQITGAAPLGQVGLDWQVAGFGDFSGQANETDMLMRHTTDSTFYVYDINNNGITGAASIGQIGLDWQVAGIAGGQSSQATSQLVQTIAGFSPSAASQSGSVVQTAPGSTAESLGHASPEMVANPPAIR